MSHRLADCVDTIVVVVTIGAGLRDRVDDAVIEHAAEGEGIDAVADAAIDRNRRVAYRRSHRVRAVVTGRTTDPGHGGIGVIGNGADEALRGMAGTAIAGGGHVFFMFTRHDSAVMTGIAGTGNAGVIEIAVG